MAAGTILVLGGARSGKSRRALCLAESLGPRRLFVATDAPLDEEMRERIARHRAERDASRHTLEAPLALPETLGRTIGGGDEGNRAHDAVDAVGTGGAVSRGSRS